MKLTPSGLISRAKELRKNQTPWEAKLWQRLRAKRFDGFKFKRQLRIEGYIVDFCCREKMLIVELDGGHHNHESNFKQDLERQKFLEAIGYKILRFWNNDIDKNLEGVLETIKENLTLP